jgi:hypothetical protein
VDVGAYEVDGWTEDVGVLDERAWDFGRADGPSVAGCAELGADIVDEACQAFGGSVAVEHGFVACYDHLDEVPLVFAPLGERLDLRVGVAADAGFVDPDAENQFQTLLCGGCANVLGAVAVGGVEANRGEAFGFDGGDVSGDSVGGLAVAVAGVGGVAEGPLVAVRNDGAVGGGG